MKAGAGFSRESDARQAGAEAAQQAMSCSGEPVLTIVFTTDQYNAEHVLEGVRRVVGVSRLVGFCCGGVITPQEILRQGVGVCTLSGNRLHVRTALETGLKTHPRVVGERVGRELLVEQTGEGLVIVLPDAFHGNVSEMLRGLYNQMGPRFRYVGGGAGDNLKFFKTYQFTDAGVVTDGVAAALISGPEIGIGLGHGWHPMSDPVVVTKTKDRTVFEMDGEPAYQAYCKRLGPVPSARFAEIGMRHPLGFPNVTGRYLIRDPIAVRSDQSMEFVTEIPCHAVGNVMRGELDELVATAAQVAEDAQRQVRHPTIALVFDCISRVVLMGEQFQRELTAVRSKLNQNLPLIGALTFGEIGAYEDVPLFHNKSVVVCVMGGREQ